jgi:hypothetical protein
VISQTLDVREDVIPSATVQTSTVFSQLVDNFVHLEDCWDGFNQNRSSDGTSLQANVVLGVVEDVVPQLGFQVVFHLWQVEVWTETLGNGFLSTVVEVDGEIENTTGDWGTVNQDVLFSQVPSSWSDNQGWDVSALFQVQVVLLAVDGGGQVSSDGVVKVDLTFNQVLPGWSQGIFEISHVGSDVRVQSVDNHLSVGWTGDFTSSVNQTRGQGWTSPGGVVSDVFCFWQKVWQETLVSQFLLFLSVVQQFLSSSFKSTVQGGDKGQGFLVEDVFGFVWDWAQDLDTFDLISGFWEWGRHYL